MTIRMTWPQGEQTEQLLQGARDGDEGAAGHFKCLGFLKEINDFLTEIYDFLKEPLDP